jgi:hypothetical protein
MPVWALRNRPLAITHAPDGHVAEWLRSGLQNRLPRFNSGRGLQSFPTTRHLGALGRRALGRVLAFWPTLSQNEAVAILEVQSCSIAPWRAG